MFYNILLFKKKKILSLAKLGDLQFCFSFSLWHGLDGLQWRHREPELPKPLPPQPELYLGHPGDPGKHPQRLVFTFPGGDTHFLQLRPYTGKSWKSKYRLKLLSGVLKALSRWKGIFEVLFKTIEIVSITSQSQQRYIYQNGLFRFRVSKSLYFYYI